MRSPHLVSSAVVFLAVAGLPALGLAQSPQPKMGQPLGGLTPAQLQRWEDGRVDFNHVVSEAEGLGPIFNQHSCGSCHNNPVGGPGSIMVQRFGFYDAKGGGFDPLAALGGSLLQGQAIAVGCQETIPVQANVTSFRVTPSVLGDGLVQAIPDAALLANETTPPSANVSGRARLVALLEDPTGPLHVGRFGWKAQLASMLSFAGDASQNELGFTNRLLPAENAPNGDQGLLVIYDTVADPEDGPDAQGRHFIDRLDDFQRFLAAPPQTPRSGMSGETLFTTVGCTDCHVAAFTTSSDPALEPALRNRVIKPYSDFLLHDMGLAADFIADGSADILEMRTPPLWGVRVRDPMWHDGRVAGGTFASRIQAAVVEHGAFGSEGSASAQAFQALTSADQDRVIAFLDSLGRAEFDGTGDGVRDAADLALFVAARNGGPYTPDDSEAVFDFDQDGDVDQADLAVFAQVYEVDCDGNGTNDLADVLAGTSPDANQNLLADACEFCQVDLGFAGGGTLHLSTCGDHLDVAGGRASLMIDHGTPGAVLLLAMSFSTNPYLILPTEYLVPSEPLALLDLLTLDAQGRSWWVLFGGNQVWATGLNLQAASFDGSQWDLSNAINVQIGF